MTIRVGKFRVKNGKKVKKNCGFYLGRFGHLCRRLGDSSFHIREALGRVGVYVCVEKYFLIAVKVVYFATLHKKNIYPLIEDC